MNSRLPAIVLNFEMNKEPIMTERMDRLPPQMRSFIARQINEQRSQGVVDVAEISEQVRVSCSASVTDRELEYAIAEEAESIGLAVHPCRPEQTLSREQG